MLPARLLLGSSIGSASTPQQQQQQLDIHVAGALMYDLAAEAVARSPAAMQHSAHVSLISSSTGSSSTSALEPTIGTTANYQQQQQQQQCGPASGHTLQPADYPWLNPALESCLARLNPRMSLQSWRAWQSAELPLPGGVLVVGGSDGGRDWLLQLLGQAAAAQHDAHVLKVRVFEMYSIIAGRLAGILQTSTYLAGTLLGAMEDRIGCNSCWGRLQQRSMTHMC
jgi:hypothetical protein